MGTNPNLSAALHAHAALHPERPAVVTADRTHSYGELAARAALLAARLRGAGLEPNGRVGVLAERGPAAYAGLFGAAWAGAAYVPLHPGQPDARLANVARRAELSALLVDASTRARVLGVLGGRELPVLALDDGEDGGAAPAAASLEPPAEVAPDALAYLMFTSGTTGEPKGVAVTAANARAFLNVVRERYRLTPDDRVSQFFELTFDLSVFDLFAAVDAGASIHVVPKSQRMAPVAFARERELSVWFSVPSTLADLMRLKALEPGALPSLRLSLFCGEPLPAACVEAWRAAAPNSAVENLYGPTEATVACLVEPCGERMAVTAERGVVAIGRPFPGMEADVHDAERGFLPAGEVGELLLSGAQVSAGYWRDEALTAERYPELEHPALGRRVWYRTGDLARKDADGTFHHLGRTDHQVKVRGHRVELEEIEAHLREAAGTAGVAAVAWPVRDGSALGVVAFLSGAAHPLEAVRKGLLARVPAYMVPRRFVELETLPRSASGKVDRRALLALLEAPAPPGPPPHHGPAAAEAL